MKKKLMILLALFVAFVVGTIGKDFVEKMLVPQESSSVDFQSVEFLSEIASKANEILPIMVDDITEHRSIIPQQGEIIHQYRLVKNVKADFDLAQFQKAVRPVALNFHCTTKNQRTLLDFGVTITNKYYDKDMVFIDGVSVTREDCKKLSGVNQP